jgi:hypothetical protein
MKMKCIGIVFLIAFSIKTFAQESDVQFFRMGSGKDKMSFKGDSVFDSKKDILFVNFRDNKDHKYTIRRIRLVRVPDEKAYINGQKHPARTSQLFEVIDQKISQSQVYGPVKVEYLVSYRDKPVYLLSIIVTYLTRVPGAPERVFESRITLRNRPQ